jgi:hypothetical protein
MARIPIYLMKILEELVSDSRATDANVDTCRQWAVEIAEVLVSTTSIYLTLRDVWYSNNIGRPI